jgi:IclR family KDG regulon transcriptional repressor
MNKKAPEAEIVDVKRRKPTAVTGLQIAEFLAANPRGMRFREIAAHVEMDPGQVHRILKALVDDDWLMTVGEDGVYALSPRVIRLSATYLHRLDLADHARPFLDALSAQTKESVFLGQLRREVVVCVGRRVADHSLRVWTELGDSWPLQGSAVGTAILAARYARVGPKLYPEAVPDEVSIALKKGYGRDFGRYREGIQAIAAPIRDASGMEIGALAISGPGTRIGESEAEKLGQLVLEAATAISQTIGYNGDTHHLTGRKVANR